MSKNAGPAFPFNERHDDGSHHHSHDGMSLRDWFAGQAMAALIPLHPRGTAREAYEYADAMLKAREA